MVSTSKILLGLIMSIIVVFAFIYNPFSRNEKYSDHKRAVKETDELAVKQEQKDTEPFVAVKSKSNSTQEDESFIKELEGLGAIELHDTIGIRWDNLSVDLKLSSCSKEDISNVFSNTSIEGTVLDEHHVNKIKGLATDLIYSFGKSDNSLWLNTLRDSQCTLNPAMLEAAENYYINTYGASEDDVKKINPWDLLVTAAEKKEGNIKKMDWEWVGLSSELSSIEIRLAKNAKQVAEHSRQKLQHMRNNQLAIPSLASAEGLASSFSNDKEVYIADFTFYILNSEEMGGRISAYTMRSWHHPIKDVWIPLQLTMYPDRNNRTIQALLPVF